MQIQITVPAGASPGTTMMAQAPDGRQVQVVVPAGVAPGAVLTVGVPAAGGGAPQQEQNMLRRLMQQDVGSVWSHDSKPCCGFMTSKSDTTTQGPNTAGEFTSMTSMKVTCCGCPCPVRTNQMTYTPDCKTWTMVASDGGRGDGFLKEFDAATQRVTWQFSGTDKKGWPFKGTTVVDYREGIATSKANGFISVTRRQPR